MKPDNKAGGPWLYALGLIPVVWFALLIAPSLSGGLSEIVNALPAAMNHPFQIVWCEDSIKAVLIFIAAYGLGIGIYLSSRRNYRRGEEHGSAKWGDPRAVNKKYRDKDPFQNRIFTQHVRMGLDGKKHRRTLNSLVCGGSGAGKSRFYAKPNLLQASHVSYFVLDCKGELLRDCGGLLERMGYEIKVVDLLNMEKSHCYNPFAYLKNDNDVQKMVTNLFKSTTPKGSQSNDPFWDTAASMLLMALVFYLHYEAPEDEKNFAMIMEMLRAGEVREDDDSYQSPLDELFERLEMRSPDHIAVKYYKDYRSGSAKTLKSIQITLAARLEKFNLSSVAALTATDELDLASLGEKKVALFALIPDNDSSFNFLVSLLYSLVFRICACIMMFCAGLLAIGGELTFARLSVILLASFTIFNPLEVMGQMTTLIRMLDSTLDRVERIKQAKRIDENGKDISLDSFDIAFDHVSFAYCPRISGFVAGGNAP